MKPFPFTIATATPLKQIQIAKDEILSRKGEMGSDSFRVEGYAGTYKQVRGGVEITITEKPTFMGVGVPNATIEKKVRGFFG